jgi:hypothetical protein
VLLSGAGAAQRVVAAAGVGDDGQHRPAFAAVEHRAGGQVDAALAQDGFGGAVVLVGVVAVVEDRVGGLVAFQVDDAQGLARFTSCSQGSPAGRVT